MTFNPNSFFFSLYQSNFFVKVVPIPALYHIAIIQINIFVFYFIMTFFRLQGKECVWSAGHYLITSFNLRSSARELLKRISKQAPSQNGLLICK